MPSGARLFGDKTSTGLPLTAGEIATTAPADFDPAALNLNENEADDIEGGAAARVATYSYVPRMAVVTLACHYGKDVPPLSGEALLLIPLKPQWARCRFVYPKGNEPGSMTCNAAKPF